MTSFYSDPFVRQRIIEFLGNAALEDATAAYLTHTDGCRFDRGELRETGDLGWFLERDMDISRSLADRESYLLHLDMEYVNFDSPVEAYMDPLHCFEMQEPVVKVVETLLLGWGIAPLHVMTGQGHHFVWRIGRDSALAERFRKLNPAPELIGRCMDNPPRMLVGSIERKDQEFFGGLSLAMEFVGHRIKEKASRSTPLPVELTAVHVGPSARERREMISIDISEYGDPLFVRVIRIPYTNYRKPWETGLAREFGLEWMLREFHAIPLFEMDYRQALDLRQREEEVQELARRASVRIPLQEEGSGRLLDEYLVSRLRRFHKNFYSTMHDPVERWPETYDKLELSLLPEFVRHFLEHPNDLLLKPVGMQMVTLCLMAQGWHPRHVAGLIRSKFEHPRYGWRLDWKDYDAAIRADFYTRLFAGLHLAGLDRLANFTCTSSRRRAPGFMPGDGGSDFESVAKILLSQPVHE